MKIKIAQIKIKPEKGKLESNHARLVKALDGISKENKIDVLVTGECYLDGYVTTESYITKDNIADYAIDADNSKYVDEISDFAKKNGCWVIYGCMRKGRQGVFNSVLIFDRSGEITGSYEKTHIQTHDLKYQAGNKLDVFESDFGKFGIMICADRRWPETTRTLTLKGANIVFNPTYGMYDDLNLAMMRTRSFENGIFIVFTHPHQSLITGPNGNVITNNEDENDNYTITEIDLTEATGSKNNHILDRRTELYKPGFPK